MGKIFEADEFRNMSGNNILNGLITNPMTASGDIIYGGSSGTPTRLPKGTDGQVLSLSSGIPSWQNASGGDEVDFNVTRTENTSGSQTIYNPTRRNWTLLDITNSASTYTITLSAKPDSGGSNTITNVEHYITIKNTNASTKTLVIQLETTGHKLISEGLTTVSLPASGIYEVSFIFLTRGSDTICAVSKSTLLAEITT